MKNMKSLFQEASLLYLHLHNCIDFMLLLNEYKTDLCAVFVDLARGKGVEQGLRWLGRVVSVLQVQIYRLIPEQA